MNLSDTAAIASINLAEVIDKLSRTSGPAWAEDSVATVDLPVLAIDRDDAIAAGLLRNRLRPFGLSLADAICLGLAKRKELVAVTADRVWSLVGQEIGVPVELIR